MDESTYAGLVHTFTTLAPGAHFMKRNSGKNWNGRVYLVRGNKFLTGLLPSVLSELDKWKVPYSLLDNRIFTAPQFKVTTVKLRDYQQEAINSALHTKIGQLWWPRGILRLATGAGKTEVAVALTEMINESTLFICHRLHLVSQAKERFERFGLKVGVVGGGKKELTSHVTVATVQTLHSMLKNNDPDLLTLSTKIKQIFFDEAHLLAAKYKDGNQFVKVSNCFPNAFYRWGLTATPFMKDSYSNYLLEGTSGQELAHVSSKELIEQKFLADIEIVFDKYPQESFPSKLSWDLEYAHGIVLHKERNNRVIHWMKQLPKPCLVLVDQIGHGDYLMSMAKKYNLEIEFVNGLTDNEERLQRINELNTGALDILLASTIFDEGVDIPEVRSIIRCAGKKSPVKLLQQIGRGLRRSKTKQNVIVVDFYDQTFTSLEKHTKQRIKLLKNEGFEVNIS